MQIEEAKKYCKQIKDRDLWKVGYVYGSEAIETVLNELEKKDTVINLMAEQLAGLAIFDIAKEEPLILGDKEEVKQYFYKKAEEK